MKLFNLISILSLLSLPLSAEEPVSWTDRVMPSRIFGESLMWVGKEPPSEAESKALYELVTVITEQLQNQLMPAGLKNHEGIAKSFKSLPIDYAVLEQFIQTYPDSAWTPCLRANLGKYYRKQGRYTLALQRWELAWAATKHLGGPSKRVADFTLAHWTSLLASLGRVDTLRKLFDETKNRPLDGGYLQQMFDAAREGYQAMLVHPGSSFQCGNYALHQLAHALNRTNFLAPLGSESPAVKLLEVPSPSGGFTLKALAELADHNGLDLVAVKRPCAAKDSTFDIPHSSFQLVVPSIVHWRQNHYAAIVAEHGGLYRVVDQTFGEPAWLTPEAINAEASGYFMVPKERVPEGWEHVQTEQLALVHGKGAPNSIKDENDQHECKLAGSNGTECETNCTGMVRWWVSEPYISLWLEDEPLGYQPSRGPRLALRLSFKQRNTRPSTQFGFSFGNNWECSWMSSIGVDNFQATNVGGFQTNVIYDATVYLPGGGVQRHSVSNQPIEFSGTNYYSQTSLKPILNSSLQLIGVERIFPDGARDVYGLETAGTLDHDENFLLSARVDALGNSNQLNYTGSRLTSVLDVDGRTNVLSYTNGQNTALVTAVTDPFGRVVTLQYHHAQVPNQWFLTNIVDPEQIFSRPAYDTNIWRLNSVTTSYGKTTFGIGGGSSSEDLGAVSIARSILVTEPDLISKHFYMYRDATTNSAVPSSHTDAPTGTPIGTLDNSNLQYRNSFYWNPRQYGNLSQTTNAELLTAADFYKGRMRHWLHLANTSTNRVSATLSMERAPSPDGGTTPTPGQKTWYDYPDKEYGDSKREGSSGLPSVITWRNPDLTNVYYIWHRRNALGYPTNIVETWSPGENGPALLRTNVFVYATNGIDLLQDIGPNNEPLARLGYNDRHQVTFYTNALSEVTTFTYNGLYQLQQVDFPNGLRRVFTYFTSGSYPNWLQQIEDQPLGRTNLFTYATNGLVSLWTDPRGLIVQLGWDKLQRVTSITFPGGTYVSNRYDKLDLSSTRDRLGNWTYFDHNALQQLIAVTNALTNVTKFDWCSCGTLDSITDPLNHDITFVHDYAGRMTQFYHDDLLVDYTYDSLGRLNTRKVHGDTAFTDRTTTYTYTLHGLPARAFTTTGQVFAVQYDNRDRPISVTNSIGFALTNAWDDLDRLSVRGWPNNTTENFVYTTNGLVRYADRLGHITQFFRDLNTRTLLVTNANTNTLTYAFNPAGDLVNLTDGKNQTTTWRYDFYGSLRTNVNALGNDVLRLEYDANWRLTNRWTPAKSNTVYKYDAVDNLTNISYRAGVTQTVSYAYDALGRLTNMTDLVGSNFFIWSPRGLLLTENGPFFQDAVTYEYVNQLRTSLSLTQSNAAPWTQNYSYDGARRLQTLTSPAGTFNYEYYTGGGGPFETRLVQKLTLPSGAYIDNSYDSLGELLQTELKNSGGTKLNRNKYAYDFGGQRTNAFFGDKDYWDCSYDVLGQLRSAQAVHEEDVQYPHEKVSWNYDGAQNLGWRSKGGLTNWFDTDSLNRLSTITRSGTMTVVGFATNNPVSVTVNGQAGTFYGDGFAASGVPLVDGTNTFTAIAQDTYFRKATNTLTAFLPATNTFVYDANGNLTSDGKRNFEYDAENRLTNMYVVSKWRTTLAYDGLSRRRIRREYDWTNSAWRITNQVQYIYDGFLILQERNSNNVPKVTYTHGVDLSGTFEGAGGVGGLLGMTTHGSPVTNYTHYFYHADGNGNITAMIDTNQIVQAHYAYEPFGNIWSQGGPLTNLNRMRFSSKEWHPQSGLLLYEFRAYDPSFQRWLTEDPIGPAGGINLYRFVRNNPLRRVDPLGLSDENRPPVSATSGPLGPVPKYGPPRPEPSITGHPPGPDFIEALVAGRDFIRDLLNQPSLFDMALEASLSEEAYQKWQNFWTLPDDGMKYGFPPPMGRPGLKPCPPKAAKVRDHVRETGKPPSGYVGGREFKNLEGRLPSGGKYREYDVDPRPPRGGRRNAERIVIDEDTGRAWYTDDHYGSFTELK